MTFTSTKKGAINILSKWSNYPNSIREKYQTPWTIRFYLVTSGPNFLGYFMIIDIFSLVFFVKIWQCLTLCSSQSKRLTIARCKIKWPCSDKILCSWSIQENLAMCGKKQSSQSPQYLRKKDNFNYPWKQTKHLKTTWTGNNHSFSSTGGPPLVRSPLVRIPLVRFFVL